MLNLVHGGGAGEDEPLVAWGFRGPALTGADAP